MWHIKPIFRLIFHKFDFSLFILTMSTNKESKIVIVKLGGAAISNKKGVCEFAPEHQLEAMFDQVQLAYDTLKKAGHRMILIHGAGCFGHPQAREYKLKDGWSTNANKIPDARYRKGYSHIRACLQQLSHSIVSRLESRNVPALAMSPIDYVVTNNCEETSTEEFRYIASRVEKYLQLGFVPVLHGDAVLDQIRGCTILSGDIIMYHLSKLLLNVVRCIFITDVNGVYQADPKTNLTGSNNIISHVILNRNEKEVVQVGTQGQENIDSKLADVTGGMQGKIRWARKIVSNASHSGIEVIICKTGSKEALDMMTLLPSFASNYTMTIFTQDPAI